MLKKAFQQGEAPIHHTCIITLLPAISCLELKHQDEQPKESSAQKPNHGARKNVLNIIRS